MPGGPADYVDDRYLDMADLIAYSGMSRRTLHDHLNCAAADAIPSYRVGGKILVKRSEFDEWMKRHRKLGGAEVNRVLAELGLSPADRGWEKPLQPRVEELPLAAARRRLAASGALSRPAAARSQQDRST